MEHQAKGLDRPKTTQVGTWSQTISSEGKKSRLCLITVFFESARVYSPDYMIFMRSRGCAVQYWGINLSLKLSKAFLL